MHAILLSLLLLQGTPVTPGVLAGRLRTIEGAPATGVRVAAVAVPQVPQTREPGLIPLQYIPPPAALVRVAVTDNAGRYRLENLPPGRYYVLAGTTDAPTYYPNAKTLDVATVFEVTGGLRREGVNFDLLWPLGIRVRGRAIPTGSQPLNPLVATLSGSKVDEHLEVPVESNGGFEFVRVPAGSFTLSLFPPPPGFRPIGVTVVDKDVTGLELPLPRTHVVTGRLAADANSPLPVGMLTFSTSLNQVSAPIAPDGSFRVSLAAGRHRVEVGGLPVGYRVASVRVGSTDAYQGVVVENSDVSEVVITLTAAAPLPRLSGRIAGVQATSGLRIELRGRHIYQSLAATVQPDGSFNFPKVLPGLYDATIVGSQRLGTTSVVVTNRSVDDLELRAN